MKTNKWIQQGCDTQGHYYKNQVHFYFLGIKNMKWNLENNCIHKNIKNIEKF